MAVALVGSVFTGTASSSQTVTASSVIIPASAELLVAVWGFHGNRTIDSMKIDPGGGDDTALTQEIKVDNGTALHITGYYVVSPPTGTFNVVGDVDGNSTQSLTVWMFSGVNTSTPISASAGNTGASATNLDVGVASGVDKHVVGGAHTDSGGDPFVADSGQTVHLNGNAGTGGAKKSFCSGDEAGEAGTQQMDWTANGSVNFAQMIMAINEAAAAAGPKPGSLHLTGVGR